MSSSMGVRLSKCLIQLLGLTCMRKWLFLCFFAHRGFFFFAVLYAFLFFCALICRVTADLPVGIILV